MFERRFESRNVRVFDVAGRHPNVVAGYSTPEKGWAYATKDGDVVAGGLEQPIGRAGLSEAGSKWARVILAESREEFLLLSRSWILGHFAAHSDLYELTPTGDIDQLSIHTSVPQEFLSARTSFQSWATGYNEIWQDLLLVSVPSLASSGGPPVIVWLGVIRNGLTHGPQSGHSLRSDNGPDTGWGPCPLS